MVAVLSAKAPFSPRGLWRSYNQSLERRPIATKAATSLIGFALGDAIAQLSSRPSSSDERHLWRFDSLRTLRLAAYGGAVAGPLGHYWFSFLDAAVFPQAPKSIQAIISKIILDQSFMTPIGATLFFSATKLMDNQASLVIPTVKERLVPTWLASIRLWPLAHAVNFAVIPSSQRLLYINVISIFWTTLLSKTASSTAKTEAIPSSPPQMVAVEVEEQEETPELSLSSIGFLEEMEALEQEYDRDLAAS